MTAILRKNEVGVPEVGCQKREFAASIIFLEIELFVVCQKLIHVYA